MIIVTVNVSNGTGQPKSYVFKQTAEPAERKSGGVTLAHYQPEAGNKVIKTFSKLYVDTAEFAKAEKTPKAEK